MVKISKPTVAGTFYPAEPEKLKQMLAHYLSDASAGKKVPKAVIDFHAGDINSRPVVAIGYTRLQSAKYLINSVDIIGPSHRVGFEGESISTAEQFAIPLGNINGDSDAIRPFTLKNDSTCGRVPVKGLLALARKKRVKLKTINLRNLGDTAGYVDKKRVVGYGALCH